MTLPNSSDPLIGYHGEGNLVQPLSVYFFSNLLSHLSKSTFRFKEPFYWDVEVNFLTLP